MVSIHLLTTDSGGQQIGYEGIPCSLPVSDRVLRVSVSALI